jgi:hypothetical protein
VMIFNIHIYIYLYLSIYLSIYLYIYVTVTWAEGWPSVWILVTRLGMLENLWGALTRRTMQVHAQDNNDDKYSMARFAKLVRCITHVLCPVAMQCFI